MTVFRPTHGFKGRIFASAEFSAEPIVISASIVTHCGSCAWREVSSVYSHVPSRDGEGSGKNGLRLVLLTSGYNLVCYPPVCFERKQLYEIPLTLGCQSLDRLCM